jgi:hypothetical protein
MSAQTSSETRQELLGSSRDRRSPRGGNWGPTLTLLALALAVALFLVVMNTMGTVWNSLPVPHAQPGDKVRTVEIVLLLGLALSRLKHSRLQFLCGLGELLAAILVGLGVASTISIGGRDDSLTIILGLLAAVFLAARGFENVAAGIARFRD